MHRRRVLALLGGSLTATAGCTGAEDGTTIRDSDGDGMIDAKDYAPNDPAVQEKSDLVTTAATAKPTTTAETTRTTRTTTPTTQATTAGAANEIEVSENLSAEQSRIVAYSATGVTATVTPSDPGLAGREGERVRLLAYAATYPREESLAYGTSDAFRLRDDETVTASVDLSGAPTGERLHYLAAVVPADYDPESGSSEDVAFVHETDPFVLRSDGATIERASHPNDLGDAEGDGFVRDAVEGAYAFTFEGSTAGTAWSVRFHVFKSAYLQMALEPRGRSRPEYVEYAQKQGFAGTLARILHDSATANDITEKREQAEFLIDFVQNLPYVPDDVSTGFDDYTKFAIETIAEAGGDCEDTSILLAALLQAEPFGYDTVLIQPPGHMAVGVYGTDLPGYYWTKDGRKYYYIETTGEGWGVGDLPETYRDAEAYVHQV